MIPLEEVEKAYLAGIVDGEGTVTLMKHHKNSYAWSVRQDRAIRFLDEIKKYLIIKKPQADLITQEYKSVTHRAGKYTPEMLDKKMRLVAKIRELNQR